MPASDCGAEQHEVPLERRTKWHRSERGGGRLLLKVIIWQARGEGGEGRWVGGGRGGGWGMQSPMTPTGLIALVMLKKKKKMEKIRDKESIDLITTVGRTDKQTDGRGSTTREFHQHTNGCGESLIAHQAPCRETAADRVGSRKIKSKNSDVTMTSSPLCMVEAKE